MKRFIVLSMTVFCLQMSAQGATVVQFVRQTATGPGYVPDAGNSLTLEEALELADVDLMTDTRLTPQQITDFIAGQGSARGRVSMCAKDYAATSATPPNLPEYPHPCGAHRESDTLP